MIGCSVETCVQLPRYLLAFCILNEINFHSTINFLDVIIKDT